MSELNRLHEAISATIKAALPQFETVEAYVSADHTTVLPALFHSITGLKPGDDPGDGRVRVIATFDARIFVASASQHAALEAVTLASQVTVLLRKQFWAQDFVDEAQAVQARPVQAPADAVVPHSWTVQWEQALYLGERQWPWPDEPGPLAFAFSPDTGPSFEADYQTSEDLQ
ncbi:hypothetical protein [Pseudomonas rubra]|uniref:Phage protein n=1 Tax=Pseudomonas rubra TaxID=2942627 RepID=A0ABT5P8S0_9PSED|nr:hypothetical protein [Pseudomonas rubra]MDD1014690.1 hypothetical protein [Pseudomonas rubra]MDD1040861.1 hypothetical protein [Pseudomonas rubra]MDD1157609.1 hypothetical protein [Pseudomonas rubra]